MHSHLHIQWETLGFRLFSEGGLVLKSTVINEFTNEVTACAILCISLAVSPVTVSDYSFRDSTHVSLSCQHSWCLCS